MRTGELAEKLGLRRDRIQHWIRMGYIEPSEHKSIGTGDHNVWTEADYRYIKRAVELVREGYWPKAAFARAQQEVGMPTAGKRCPYCDRPESVANPWQRADGSIDPEVTRCPCGMLWLGIDNGDQ